MNRQIGCALLALVLAASSARAASPVGGVRPEEFSARQGQDARRDERGSQQRRGPWAWWKDKDAVAELGITPTQAAEIDRIFHATMKIAKPLRDEVKRLEQALNATMKAKTADVSVVEQQVDTVESKRAELNKMRVVMLYRMHRVLSPEQNAKFEAMVERWEASRRRSDGDRRR